MILVVGNMNLSPVIDSLILMAKDQTKTHELNQEHGNGSWIHPDGWGIAYLQDGKFIIKKSTVPIWEDQEIELLKNLRTPIALLHVRRKTMGVPHIENTHPFKIEKGNQGEYVFCHNGTIEDEISFNPNFELVGSTDSEKLFYSILSDLDQYPNSNFITHKIKAFSCSSGSNIILVNKEKSIVGVNYNKYDTYYRMSLAKLPEGVIISSEELPLFSDIEWTRIDNSNIATINNQSQEYHIETVSNPIEPENLLQ